MPTTAEEEEWMDLLQRCDSIGQVTARDISWRRCHLHALFLSGPSPVYLVPAHTYSTDHTIHTYAYRTSSPQHRRCLVRYSKSRVRGSRSPPAIAHTDCCPPSPLLLRRSSLLFLYSPGFQLIFSGLPYLGAINLLPAAIEPDFYHPRR